MFTLLDGMSGIRSTPSFAAFLYIFRCIFSLSALVYGAALVSHFFVYVLSVPRSAIGSFLKLGCPSFSNITFSDLLSFLLALLLLGDQCALDRAIGPSVGSIHRS